MPHDDATLPESFAEALVRAGFDGSTESRATLMSALHHQLPRARSLAIRGLARHQCVDTAILLPLLHDGDLRVVRDALEVTAHLATLSPDIAEALGQLLSHADPLVVEAAIFAVGEHGLAQHVEDLNRITASHDDARCREAGVIALGQIGLDQGRDVILAALQDKPTVRRRAVVALASFEGPEIEMALDVAAQDRDWQVRSAVEQLRRDPD
ncbi:MAG: HEAT repeat domain-containing protein [Actinomycetes bacterium]